MGQREQRGRSELVCHHVILSIAHKTPIFKNSRWLPHCFFGNYWNNGFLCKLFQSFYYFNAFVPRHLLTIKYHVVDSLIISCSFLTVSWCYRWPQWCDSQNNVTHKSERYLHYNIINHEPTLVSVTPWNIHTFVLTSLVEMSQIKKNSHNAMLVIIKEK